MPRKPSINKILYVLENPADKQCEKILKHAQVGNIAKAQKLLGEQKKEKTRK